MLTLIFLAQATEPSKGLELTELTQTILDANPETAMAMAALTEARARSLAATPWPDPMVDIGLAPLAQMPAWQMEIRQDIPIGGTRQAARAMAEADANVAASRLDIIRLELAEMAAMAWTDWYMIYREIELTEKTLTILQETRKTTLSRMATGLATDLDLLQMDNEIGWLHIRTRTLTTERDILAIRINTLAHRAPNALIAPPPQKITLPTPIIDGTRPERLESEAMTQAAEANERMAQSERLPMLGLMTDWNSMQTMPEDRWMAGISLQIPLDQKARTAIVTAATAKTAATHAETLRVEDQIAEQIAIAEHRYQGDTDILAILEKEILPNVRTRLSATRAGYAAGTIEIRQLLEAERANLEAETRYEQQRATLVLCVRELELAHGILLPGSTP